MNKINLYIHILVNIVASSSYRRHLSFNALGRPRIVSIIVSGVTKWPLILLGDAWPREPSQKNLSRIGLNTSYFYPTIKLYGILINCT